MRAALVLIRRRLRSRRRLGGDDRGQALVEFALILPILLLLLIGLFEFARAWNVYQVVTDAAREGARKGVLDDGQGNAEAEAVVRQALANGRVNPNAAGVTISVTGANSMTGQPVTVEIGVPYSFPFTGAMLKWATKDRNITIRSRMVMRHE